MKTVKKLATVVGVMIIIALVLRADATFALTKDSTKSTDTYECGDMPAYAADVRAIFEQYPDVAVAMEDGELLTMTPRQLASVSEDLEDAVDDLDEMKDDGRVPDGAKEMHEAVTDLFGLLATTTGMLADGNIWGIVAYTDAMDENTIDMEEATALLESRCGVDWATDGSGGGSSAGGSARNFG